MPENQINELGLTVGFPVDNWQGAAVPSSQVLNGTHCRCEPLDLATHSQGLFEAYKEDTENRIWVYLPYGPFETIDQYRAWMQEACFTGDPFFYAIIDCRTDRPLGVASYLRIKPEVGSIEVGHINYAPALQGTVAATEAMYLMMKNAFDMGYRRYEWKCNALNDKSCNAALRLGFTHEGIFRQMLVVKGQNRDSAWYSLLDREWPAVQAAFQTWLSGDNFDAAGIQRQPLSEMTRVALASLQQ